MARMILMLTGAGSLGTSLLRCAPGHTAVFPSFCLPLQGTELYIPVCVWMADTVTSPFGHSLPAPRLGHFR